MNSRNDSISLKKKSRFFLAVALGNSRPYFNIDQKEGLINNNKYFNPLVGLSFGGERIFKKSHHFCLSYNHFYTKQKLTDKNYNISGNTLIDHESHWGGPELAYLHKSFLGQKNRVRFVFGGGVNGTFYKFSTTIYEPPTGIRTKEKNFISIIDRQLFIGAVTHLGIELFFRKHSLNLFVSNYFYSPPLRKFMINPLLTLRINV